MEARELTGYQAMEASAVQLPYLILAGTLFAIAVVFAVVKLPIIQAKAERDELAQLPEIAELPSAWHFPHLIFGAIGIFLYVGAEVAIGSFLVSFLAEPNISTLSASEAAKYVSIYWGGAMVGRFVGAAVMQKILPGKVLMANALCAAILVVATISASGLFAMTTILAVGFFNSIMFPTIFSLALKGLGKHSGQGSGILCSAIVGGAVLPVLQGLFADRIGVQQAFFLPALCYLYIAYYGNRDWRRVAY